MKRVNNDGLVGRVALITGSTRGIGAYYAHLLASYGVTVIISGRHIQACQHIVSSIESSGGKADFCVLDLEDIKSFKSKLASIIQKYGHLDILINNAAVSKDMTFFNITEDSWDTHLDTNLKGTFFLSQEAAKIMSKQDGMKKIVNIAAINGHKVRKNCIPFSISKAGIIHLTKLMAYELISHNIQVNAIALGLIASEGVQAFLDNDNKAKDYLRRIPQGRAGEYHDLAGPILLLTSEASNYMTGSILTVDGGFSCDVFMDTSINY